MCPQSRLCCLPKSKEREANHQGEYLSGESAALVLDSPRRLCLRPLMPLAFSSPHDYRVQLSSRKTDGRNQRPGFSTKQIAHSKSLLISKLLAPPERSSQPAGSKLGGNRCWQQKKKKGAGLESLSFRLRVSLPGRICLRGGGEYHW